MYSLITNSKKGTLLDELVQSLETCQRFYLNVAFINFSGLQLLLDPIQKAAENGASGKILTGTYLNFTEPYALTRLKAFQHIDTRIFVATQQTGFHPKAYIFEYTNYYKVIVGSSNITQSALKSNIEWNLQIITKDGNEDEEFISEIMEAYNLIWGSSEILDDAFINDYASFLSDRKKDLIVQESYPMVFQFTRGPSIKPNMMQELAMEKLMRLREKHQEKALVIAATGTGKTYMAAFDVKQTKPERLLFLVHREDILHSAMSSFKKIINLKDKSTGILSGTSKEHQSDYLFATIQSMKNIYAEYDPGHFDYIIVDEAHHATSPRYMEVLEHFNPKFLLGMTATPERTDGGNIFDLFDNNVPVEIRLREALEYDLLVPFHYFGITDESGVDLKDSENLTPDQIAKRLSVHRRVDFIIEKMNYYGHDGLKRKALGFCMTIAHAEFMAEEFNKRGIPSIALSGGDKVSKRESYTKLLEAEDSDLEVIFTVDIFNEGIDIPGVNLVMMLRPTQSSIIFTQQLGRGLRKKDNKEFLTVLDFIGNYSKSFLIAIALNGRRFYDKDSVKTSVKRNFSDLPGATHIQLDEVSKQQILEQIDFENFSTLAYLKNTYNEFKNLNSGRIPWLLQDYLKVDAAPDPVKFFSRSGNFKAKNYIEFLDKVEPNNELVMGLQGNPLFMAMLTDLSQKLPLVRLHENMIITYLLTHETCTLETARAELLEYLDTVDDETILHAFRTLNMEFSDKGELKSARPLVTMDDRNVLHRTEEFSIILADEQYRPFIEDVLHYGRMRYLKTFGSINYGIPHLKLYEEYTMRDIAVVSNYKKIHSSFRGQGVLKNDEINHYFYFVDLHKGDDVEERVNYKDKFINTKQFQWESPNSTKVDSDRGQDFINAKKRGVTLHLFARKFKQIDNVTSKFIYLGKINPLSYRNEKPIEIQYKLQNEVPWELYQEFEPELIID